MGAAYDKAVILHRQKRYDLAREQIAKELAENPNAAHAFGLLAWCNAGEQCYRQGRRNAEQAIALGPSVPNSYFCLAWVFYYDHKFSSRNRISPDGKPVILQEDRLELAETAIREAIRLAPLNADYLALLGWIRYSRRDYGGAIEAARKGLEVDPSSSESLRVQAHALQTIGRVHAAEEVSRAALASNTGNVLCHITHGRSLLLSSDWAGALDQFREAMRLDPNCSDARKGLIAAFTYARNPLRRLIVGRYRRALESLPRTIEMGIVAGFLLVLPFLPVLLRRHFGLSAIHAPLGHLLVLAATIPIAVLLSLPLWTLIVLQFDRDARRLLPIEDSVGATIVVLAIILAYLYLAFEPFLSSWQQGLIGRTVVLLGVFGLWLLIPLVLLARGIVRFRNWRRSRSQGKQLQ